MTTTAQVISKEELLKHWQGHRFVTRRVIERFPEDAFFEFTIGGMRPFSGLVSELLSIAVPALKSIIARDSQPYTEEGFILKTKSDYLQKWDEATEEINRLWAQIPEEDFEKTFNLFGQYEFPIYQNILYFIDNEIHHRGQAFVYLRALGIEPPFFWERWLGRKKNIRACERSAANPVNCFFAGARRRVGQSLDLFGAFL